MKVLSDFGSNAFSPMLVDICWIYTEGHPGMFLFISLGSLVLFKDSKTMGRFFGRRNFELFQCSAEGCNVDQRKSLKKVELESFFQTYFNGFFCLIFPIRSGIFIIFIKIRIGDVKSFNLLKKALSHTKTIEK